MVIFTIHNKPPITLIQSIDLYTENETLVKLSTVLNSVGLGYLSLDQNFALVEVNDKMLGLIELYTGQKPDKGFMLLDHLPKKDKAKIIELCQKALTGIKDNSYLFTLQLSAAEQAHYKIMIEPAYDKSRNIIGVIAVIQDKTNLHNAEKENQALVERLINHTKNQEQFNYIISHNLRSPVANIIGLTYLLQNKNSTEKEFEMYLQGLITSTKQLDEVISDLHTIIALKNGYLEALNNVSLNELTESIQEELKTIIKIKNALIYTNFVKVKAIQSIKPYLKSVFYNLINNSLKYCKPNQQPIIHIRSYQTAKNFVVSFKDNGIGIDLEKYGDKLFRLYNRFHLEYEGKGMGLFMVKTQVELLNGTIKVKSKPGEGTEFIIKFKKNY